ncbi:MAG: ATP-binding protein [Limisphaerales bacterium]
MISSASEINSLDRAILGWMQELSPHGILITDAELRIKRWNLWLQTASGLKEEAVVDRSLFEVFPELAKRRMDRYFRAAMKGEVSLLASALHGYLLPFASPVREAGFLHMLQTARIAPLIETGQIVGTITTIEDVTQREFQNSRVYRQHQRQELLSWALGKLIETPDPESMVKNIFPQFSSHIFVDTFFNYLLEPDGEHLRLHSSGGVSRENREKLQRITVGQALCITNRSHSGPVVFSCIQESTDPEVAFPRELGLRAYICNPLLVGDKLIGTLAFASRSRDRFAEDEIAFTQTVTQYVAIAIDRARKEAALRKAQQELTEHAELLEKKVEERTRRLRETISELETFSYSLAHDVRAPLRHIHGFSHVLVEDHAHELSPSARRYVDNINRSIRRLDKLTKDILDYSKVSSKPLQMVRVDVESLFKEIITHNTALQMPGVVTMTQPFHPVLAEKSLLDQCLTNLMDNALKFVPEDIPPRINVSTELRATESPEAETAEPQPERRKSATRKVEGAKQWVRIYIKDNGIGIAPEFHGKIFGIFERLSHQKEGTGIGLAIVSKAIQRMGGHIGVESESGQGSTFWIELPAAE